MKLTFLGSGSAFTCGGNYQSNLLFEAGGERLLIDCGSDVRHALHEKGLFYRDIDAVYISHLHSDHVGGMEWLGFSCLFDPETSRPDLYINENLKEKLWFNVLQGGMGSLEGETPDLHSYFKVHSVPNNGFFLWNGVKFQLVQTIHVINGYHYAPCFGLLFNVQGVNVFFSSDIQYAPKQFSMFYEAADIIFHDAETLPLTTGVHPSFEDLCNLPDAVRDKMWLYHYNPGELPDARAAGFRGFVEKGQVFDFADRKTLLPR
ncbi:MAG: MBL fold metallo-hydrolase [Desulfovibrio sp.]|uniref:MBL fold metallo-hydrolase n=1 Tax=Desulfovibrio sp. 7SRBS1 TaxID=3378064 RepID=UPI003B3E6275